LISPAIITKTAGSPLPFSPEESHQEQESELRTPIKDDGKKKINHEQDPMIQKDFPKMVEGEKAHSQRLDLLENKAKLGTKQETIDGGEIEKASLALDAPKTGAKQKEKDNSYDEINIGGEYIGKLIGDFLEKQDKVYFDSDKGEKAPEGAIAARGPRGGEYYVAQESVPEEKTPDMRPKRGQRISPSGVRIPPNWKNVMIARRKNSSLQAVGRDLKGRRVYLYSKQFSEKNAAAKFTRLKKFHEVYPALMKIIESRALRNEEAAVLYLIAKTGFRIGSEKDTKAKKKAYGASTLEKQHIRIDGDKIKFHFIGKKGVMIDKTIADPLLAKIISAKLNRKQNQIFKTDDGRARSYLKSLPGGKPFLVKDFRTYIGTEVALKEINRVPKSKVPSNGTQLKKRLREIAEKVAKVLGNTPAVALRSYIAPEIFSFWNYQVQRTQNV
ncbi:MAG: hypothetical protein AABX71_03505, partial [Nanoarchaeota archaeon]